MSSIFSAAPCFIHDDPAVGYVELQLIQDEELMDIWEQTQKAVWVLEDKGWDATAAMHYGNVLVWEMQRRLARQPSGWQFGALSQLNAAEQTKRC